MAITHTAGTQLPLLDARERDRLEKRLRQAVTRARRRGRGVLAAVTVPAPAHADPTATVCASRRPGEPWFAFEQPARGAAALGALGCAAALEQSGHDRFGSLAARWREMAGEALTDDDPGPPGSGPVAVGGFAFDAEGGGSPQWDGFAPASLVVPEVALARRKTPQGADVRLTLMALAGPDDAVDDLLARLIGRAQELCTTPLPLLDPAPVGRFRVQGTMPPEHYVQAVSSAVDRIRSGDLEKVVLAREVEVLAPVPHDPAAVLGVLREEFPSCFIFCVGRGDAAFLGASPELLIRREGMRASTLALAGSTRRSADPSVDDHLGEQLLRSDKDREEQAIVTRRIERALRPHAVWVTSASEPVLVKVANIQHLATPIRAQLAAPLDVIELAGVLHPTPAVGGEPRERAAPLIPALEGMDRGWYAGPIGWSDASGDGELCVALRCALVRGTRARCYAGVGVVRDSDPAAELTETEVKLAALLPVLAG